MTEPAAAAAPETVAQQTAGSTIMELLTEAAPKPAAKGAEAAPVAAAKLEPKGFIDPLDEENFSDDKLATPEGVRAARALLQAELKAAKEIRQKAHNVRAEVERKAAKFKGEKAEVLAEREAVRSEKAMIDAHVKSLRGGDVKQFIQAVGALSGAEDPHGFWMDAAVELAQGKALEKKAGVVDEELRKEVEALKAERQAEREALAASQTQQAEQQILGLRIQQIEEASTFADMPNVAGLVSKDLPQEDLIRGAQYVDARLMAIKNEHFAKHKTPLDTRAACGILEAEIQSHLELLQRAGNPRGALDGAREAAPPVGGLARQPERQIAKPEPTPGASAQNRSASAIPASLAAVASTTTRARTKAEKDAATIAGLEELGVFANFGMR